MMNKTRKLAMLVLIFLGGFWLSGCQLAQETIPEDETVTEPDMLCGVYLTWETLPVVSMDDGRIYATISGDFPDVNFEFVGVEGIPFFIAKVYGAPGEGDDFTKTVSNEHSFGSDIKINVTENEDGTSLYEDSISGKVLVSEEFSKVMYYNEVYETPEGLIYMTPGDFGTSIGVSGIKVTKTMSSTLEFEGNTRTNVCEITVECVEQIQQTIIREMSIDNQLLFSNVITENAIPENIVLNPETAYVIVEEHYPDGQGGTKITRTIMDYIPDQELGYGYIVFDEDGIASSEYVRMDKAS